MADSLDDLEAAGLFHGMHMCKVGEGWACQMKAAEMPSVSGEPMYRSFTAKTPEAAIAKAVAATVGVEKPAPVIDMDDLI